MRRNASALLLMVHGAVPLLGSAQAYAQPAGPDARGEAEVLFDEATAGMDAKQYQLACPKLERVVHLVPNGIGARLALSECYEGMRRIASAWKACVAAERLAADAAKPSRRQEATRCKTRLEVQTAKLMVIVPEVVRSLPGLVIQFDGSTLEPASWGTLLAIDRGTHEIVATAAGGRSWRTSIDIQHDAITENIEVDVPEPSPAQTSNDEHVALGQPPREDSSASGPVPVRNASPAGETRSSANRREPGAANLAGNASAHDSVLLRTVGTAGMSIGAMGLGFGVVAGLVEGASEADTGVGTAALVGLTAGGALLALGVGLTWVSYANRPSTTVSVSPGGVCLRSIW